MRQGIRTEIDWKLVGAELAQADDEQQAACFTAFCKECRSFGTHFQAESQLAFVNQKLSEENKELLKMLSYTED